MLCLPTFCLHDMYISMCVFSLFAIWLTSTHCSPNVLSHTFRRRKKKHAKNRFHVDSCVKWPFDLVVLWIVSVSDVYYMQFLYTLYSILWWLLFSFNYSPYEKFSFYPFGLRFVFNSSYIAHRYYNIVHITWPFGMYTYECVYHSLYYRM